MSSTSLDFSRRPELALHAEIVAAVEDAEQNLVRDALAEQVSGDGGRLPTQMSPHDPKHARRLLEAMIIGMT
jgi:hypothetical protein